MGRTRIRVLLTIAAILIVSGLCVWAVVQRFGVAGDPIAGIALDDGARRQSNYMCEPDPQARLAAIRECTMPVPCVTPQAPQPGAADGSALNMQSNQCVQPTNACIAHVQTDIRRIGRLPADTSIAVLRQGADTNSWQVTTTRPSDNDVGSYIYRPCAADGRGALAPDTAGEHADRAARSHSTAD